MKPPRGLTLLLGIMSFAGGAWASGAPHPGSDAAVKTLDSLDGDDPSYEAGPTNGADAAEAQLKDMQEKLKIATDDPSKAAEILNEIINGPKPKAAEPAPDANQVLDYQVLLELLGSAEPVDQLKKQIADQIATGPLRSTNLRLQKVPVVPDILKKLKVSTNFENAFWELPLDLLRAHKNDLNGPVCSRINRLLVWGLYAGFEKKFLLGDLQPDTRDGWASLIVSLNVGTGDYNVLGPACSDTLGLARVLWQRSLKFRQFSVGGSSFFSKAFHISMSEMVWFDDQEEPFVVDLSFYDTDNHLALGSLSRRPPSGNWYTRKDVGVQD